MIVGRIAERARIDRLLADARAGRSGVLAIRGEAGVGKTVLLDHAAACGLRLLRGVGIESEAELPFAALHQLVYPYLDRLAALPAPQAAALQSAFGLAGAPVRDRFLVGAATLSLLSELASEGPLLAVLDDVQWFDRASLDALLFAARRLHADPLAMVVSVREPGSGVSLSGIDVLDLTGLDPASARALLAEHADGLSASVCERILREAGGNPLAVIELARTLNALQSDGRAAPPVPIGPLPVAGRVQEAFGAQVADLPDATQWLLLVAAADDTASPAVVVRAGQRLGLSPAALDPAERARLVTVSADVVEFRHPLIRSATYQTAPHARRLAVHRAIAEVLDPARDADRRAWHLAAAAAGPDEDVATELDRVAERAERRGGSTATALALERAARLSADPDLKARRLVGAARAAYDAGHPDRATEFAVQAAALTADASVVAEAGWIRAQVEYERTSPAAAATAALEAARSVAGADAEQAVPILTEAVWCARDAADHALIRRCADLLATVELPPGSARLMAGGLADFARYVDEVTAEAVGGMRALALAARSGSVEGYVERLIAGYLAFLVAEDETATEVLSRLIDEVRANGALGWLSYGLEPLAVVQVLRGRFRDAQVSTAEGLSLAGDLDQDTQVLAMKAIAAWIAAVTGAEAECVRLAGAVLDRAELHPTNAALAGWGLGLLDLAAGRAEAAAGRLDAVCGGLARHDIVLRAIPDQIEAAVRSGQPGRGERHLGTLHAWAEHTGRAHAAALVHRSRAMLLDGDEAEDHYTAALTLHEDDDRPYDLARTRLLYGEWLRRRRRRSAARAQLTEAVDGFERLGAARWADRARAELAAVGDRPAAGRSADADPVARLTPQELQVVRLAAAGMSNREIGAQLFLSPRTVGHHLYRAYPKLGITRRIELTHLVL
nr:LuxR family transcriptional regulator [uncultured Actinoplanes sp.]